MGDSSEELRQKLQTRFNECLSWANDIVTSADPLLETNFTERILFNYALSAPTDFLTPDERAQTLLFLDKLASIPNLSSIDVKLDGGKPHLANLELFKGALHDFRPLVMNVRDKVHYAKIHSFCAKALNNRDPSLGLSISVAYESGEDVTMLFCDFLTERKKAVARIIEASDFDFVYNGILQHADERFGTRYRKEHYSGQLTYTLFRNSQLLKPIGELLSWHASLIKVFNPPNLGGL